MKKERKRKTREKSKMKKGYKRTKTEREKRRKKRNLKNENNEKRNVRNENKGSCIHLLTIKSIEKNKTTKQSEDNHKIKIANSSSLITPLRLNMKITRHSPLATDRVYIKTLKSDIKIEGICRDQEKEVQKFGLLFKQNSRKMIISMPKVHMMNNLNN